MNRSEWAVFDSMIEGKELERIGISEDRDVILCITRMCGEYVQKQSLLARAVPHLQKSNEVLHKMTERYNLVKVLQQDMEELDALLAEIGGGHNHKWESDGMCSCGERR